MSFSFFLSLSFSLCSANVSIIAESHHMTMRTAMLSKKPTLCMVELKTERTWVLEILVS